MRIAIPIFGKRDRRVNPHFGHASVFAIHDTETGETTIVTHDKTEEGTCSPARFLVASGIDAVYTLGMGYRALQLLRMEGIRVLTGPYTRLEEVIKNPEKLEDYEEYCKSHGTCH